MSGQVSDRYSEALVLRVNELFYDSENEEYRDVHEEMLGREGERWSARARRLFTFDHPATVVDLGSGAGLVGISIIGALGVRDRFICADLSAGMLEVARRNLARLAPGPRLEFVKIERTIPYRLPFEDASVDVVTMNSVLHHIKATGDFLAEIDRVLRPGGLVMIGHEPNRAFYESRFLRWHYALLKPFFIPKNFVKDALLRTGLRALAERIYYAVRPGKRRTVDEMMEKINRTLADEGLATRPLELAEIAIITDIRDAEGFHGDRLMQEHGLDRYELVDFETYHPISLVSIKFGDLPVLRAWDRFLGRRHPRQGATFFSVYRKR